MTVSVFILRETVCYVDGGFYHICSPVSDAARLLQQILVLKNGVV